MRANWRALGAALVLCSLPRFASAQSLQDAAGQFLKGAAETAGKVGGAAVNAAARVVNHPAVQNATGATARAAGQVAQTVVDGVGSFASNRDVARAVLAGGQVVDAAGAITQPIDAARGAIVGAAIDQSPIPAELRPLAKDVAGIALDNNRQLAAGRALFEANARNVLSTESNGPGPRIHGVTSGAAQGATVGASISGESAGGYPTGTVTSSMAAQQAQQQYPQPQGISYWNPRIAPNEPVRIAAMDSGFARRMMSEQQQPQQVGGYPQARYVGVSNGWTATSGNGWVYPQQQRVAVIVVR